MKELVGGGTRTHDNRSTSGDLLLIYTCRVWVKIIAGAPWRGRGGAGPGRSRRRPAEGGGRASQDHPGCTRRTDQAQRAAQAWTVWAAIAARPQRIRSQVSSPAPAVKRQMRRNALARVVENAERSDAEDEHDGHWRCCRSSPGRGRRAGSWRTRSHPFRPRSGPDEPPRPFSPSMPGSEGSTGAREDLLEERS